MPDDSLAVEFVGPFSWPGGGGTQSILETGGGKKSGVYLWTVAFEEGELIYYVGETGRSFAKRMDEHYKEHASGGYHLYDPSEFRRGHKVALWHGLYGRDRERSRLDFFLRYRELAPAIAQLTEMYRFHLAPLTCERRMRERIEAALAQHLYEQPGVVGEFQDRGIAYRPRISEEEAVLVSFRSVAHLAGLPESLWL